jgi:hypothetical protein
MVERIKLASDVMCWELVFKEAIHAYLKRKLRGVMLRLQSDKSISSPAASSVKQNFTLRVGDIYYLSLGETNQSEDDLIYFPVRLTRFTPPHAKMKSIQLAVEFLDAGGNVCDVKILILNMIAIYANMFVPKAEFEANPLGTVMYSLRASLLSDHSDTIPTDFSSYTSDMRLILSHVASLCAHFRVLPSMLPDPIKQSPFSVSKGSTTLRFTQIDHGASFKPFFSDKTAGCGAEQRCSLLDTPALRESNRCFFIHLGVALGLHPLALQSIFRAHSDVLLKRLHLALSQKTHEDDQRFDVMNMFEASLRSVLQHNDMIDAPILGIVWPQEFQVLILTYARVALLISRQNRSCRMCASSFSPSDATGRSQARATCSAPAIRPKIQTSSTAPTSSLCFKACTLPFCNPCTTQCRLSTKYWICIPRSWRRAPCICSPAKPPISCESSAACRASLSCTARTARVLPRPPPSRRPTPSLNLTIEFKSGGFGVVSRPCITRASLRQIVDMQ